MEKMSAGSCTRVCAIDIQQTDHALFGLFWHSLLWLIVLENSRHQSIKVSDVLDEDSRVGKTSVSAHEVSSAKEVRKEEDEECRKERNCKELANLQTFHLVNLEFVYNYGYFADLHLISRIGKHQLLLSSLRSIILVPAPQSNDQPWRSGIIFFIRGGEESAKSHTLIVSCFKFYYLFVRKVMIERSVLLFELDVYFEVVSFLVIQRAKIHLQQIEYGIIESNMVVRVVV